MEKSSRSDARGMPRRGEQSVEIRDGRESLGGLSISSGVVDSLKAPDVREDVGVGGDGRGGGRGDPLPGEVKEKGGAAGFVVPPLLQKGPPRLLRRVTRERVKSRRIVSEARSTPP